MSTTIAKNILNDSNLILNTKILIYLILYILENLCAINLAFYLLIEPLKLYFTLNTHL